MINSEKLNSIIGVLLDQVDESMKKKEAPNSETLETLKLLIGFTASIYRLDGNAF